MTTDKKPTGAELVTAATTTETDNTNSSLAQKEAEIKTLLEKIAHLEQRLADENENATQLKTALEDEKMKVSALEKALLETASKEKNVSNGKPTFVLNDTEYQIKFGKFTFNEKSYTAAQICEDAILQRELIEAECPAIVAL